MITSQEDTDFALALLLSENIDQNEYETFNTKDDTEDFFNPRQKQKKQAKIKPKEKAVTDKNTKEKTPKVIKEGMNSGKFSDFELSEFKIGLELYGRDWVKVSAHVKTRDANAVKSHAQKYFIKLFRDNLDLPAKVIESGGGYTLSGKALDPESAAARPYLNRTTANSTTALQPGASLPKPKRAKKPVEIGCKTEQESQGDELLLNITKSNQKLKKSLKRSVSNEEIKDAIKTEYAEQRPKRTKKLIDPILSALEGQDGHVMIPCEEYSGIPGSKQPGSQPFSIKMSKEALIVMDIHSHLLSTEVIGFLGGIWNPTEKVLEITQALPCKSIENIAKELQKKSDDYTETKTENKKKNLNEDRHYNVELCPTSEVQIRDYCEQHNLTIVGWYHSHPTFRPDPSLIDLFNQRNYQSLFRSTNSEEPFVGAIVSPYDSRQQSSSFNWFNVGNEQGNMNRPKHLRYELKVFDSLGDLEIEKIIKLVNESGKRGDRVDFGKPWRKDGNQSRLEKIVKAMMEHFDPESLEMTKLVHSLVTEIKKWE